MSGDPTYRLFDELSSYHFSDSQLGGGRHNYSYQASSDTFFRFNNLLSSPDRSGYSLQRTYTLWLAVYGGFD